MVTSIIKAEIAFVLWMNEMLRKRSVGIKYLAYDLAGREQTIHDVRGTYEWAESN